MQGALQQTPINVPETRRIGLFCCCTFCGFWGLENRGVIVALGKLRFLRVCDMTSAMIGLTHHESGTLWRPRYQYPIRLGPMPSNGTCCTFFAGLAIRSHVSAYPITCEIGWCTTVHARPHPPPRTPRYLEYRIWHACCVCHIWCTWDNAPVASWVGA